MNKISYEQLYQALLEFVPELRRNIEAEFGSDYDLSCESPGAYPIFEDVVQDFLWKNLTSSLDGDVLSRLFSFFEVLANSEDTRVTDLLKIAVLEPLVYRSDLFRRARPYIGRRTGELASRCDVHRGHGGCPCQAETSRHRSRRHGTG
jgi:hypothetical protein